MSPPAPSTKVEDRFTKLTERQRIYLRHVIHNLKSKEIAKIEGASPRSIDKQLMQAKDILGAADRFEAARMFALYEAGVVSSSPATILPVQPEIWPLPSPLPIGEETVKAQSWRQLTAWVVIIAVATPLAIGAAAMLLFALSLLIGGNPR